MTPRVDAWMRQANSDWAVAELTAKQGFHSQACYHYGQAAEKALSRMNSETRYPSDSEAPADRFDEQDSEEARSVAEHVLAFAKASLQL